MSKIRGRMNPPIPLIMRIVILFDWRMEYFLCLVGPKNSHPKLNWMAIYSQFSLALEGWGGHWLKQGISKLSLDKGNKLKEGQRGLPRKRFFVYVEKKKKGGWSVRKDLVIMCGEVFMGKVCARIKHGRRLCVASTCTKASGFFVQLVVLSKSTVGFVSNLNQF